MITFKYGLFLAAASSQRANWHSYLAKVISDAAKRLCPTVRPARVLHSWTAQPATPHDQREVCQC